MMRNSFVHKALKSGRFVREFIEFSLYSGGVQMVASSAHVGIVVMISQRLIVVRINKTTPETRARDTFGWSLISSRSRRYEMMSLRGSTSFRIATDIADEYQTESQNKNWLGF